MEQQRYAAWFEGTAADTALGESGQGGRPRRRDNARRRLVTCVRRTDVKLARPGRSGSLASAAGAAIRKEEKVKALVFDGPGKKT